MIISHKHKFIFIKTMKTAGTSVEVYLSQHCAPNDILTPIVPHVDPHQPRNYKGLWNPLSDIADKRGRGIRRELKEFFRLNKFYNHIPASYVKRRVGSVMWNDYFKFCIERNPWDKTLSHFYMVNDRSSKQQTLDEYLCEGKFCLNYPKYTDDDGTLMVDKVIKYEHLNEELGEVFERLKIPFSGNLGVKAKSEHRTDKSQYQSVLNEYQQSTIAAAFSPEITMHGYKYD